MKGTLVNRIDVEDDTESSHIEGSTSEVAPTTVEVSQRVAPIMRNSRTNESRHSQRGGHTTRTSITSSDIVNLVDLDDIEAVPPSLSRQEPIGTAAPRATLNRPHRRMLVDVDAFMDVEKNEDEIADDSIPSVTPSPQRSASQNAAIKAVLGHDDFDKGGDGDLKKINNKQDGACGESLAGLTVDLSEDEIAAIVPPNLQRHGGSHNSTPGAFPVPGRGGVAPTRTSASARRTHSEQGLHGDGLRIITATLVGSQELEENQDGPMLVYAERLWWKRRLVLCLSGWVILAVCAISVSITLAIRYSNDEASFQSPASNVSYESDDRTNSTIVTNEPTVPSVSNETTVPSVSPSSSPIDLTVSPVVDSPAPTIDVAQSPIGTMLSMHSASWGFLTSCNDFDNTLQSFELIFKCGGGAIALEQNENITCSNSTIESNELRCRLNSLEPYIDQSTNDVYHQATGLALFSCSGITWIELAATVQMLNVSMSNCSLPSSIGKASTFVSMGRLCKNEDQLKLHDFISTCESGDTRTSTPVLDSILDGFFEFVDDTFKFCYATASCADQSVPTQECSFNVPNIISSNALEICSDPGNDDESIDKMWAAAQNYLDPSMRMDIIVRDILG